MTYWPRVKVLQTLSERTTPSKNRVALSRPGSVLIYASCDSKPRAEPLSAERTPAAREILPTLPC